MMDVQCSLLLFILALITNLVSFHKQIISSTLQYSTVYNSTVQYGTVQYRTGQDSTVQGSKVQGSKAPRVQGFKSSSG